MHEIVTTQIIQCYYLVRIVNQIKKKLQKLEHVRYLCMKVYPHQSENGVYCYITGCSIVLNNMFTMFP